MKKYSQNIIVIFFFVTSILSLVSCNEKRKYDGYLYPIRENGLYGYIDSVGNRIIEPEFLWVSTFHNGLAMAIVDTIYRDVPDSMAYEVGERNTIFNVYRLYAKYGYIDKKSHFVIEPNYLTYVDLPEKGFYVADFDGCYNAFSKHFFSNKRALFYDTTTWKNGFIDIEGTVIIKPKYYYAARFNEGLAVVRDAVAEPLYTNNACVTPSRLRCAYIDTLGNSITDFKYETLTRFCSGRGVGVYKSIVKDTIDDDDSFVIEAFREPRFLIDKHGEEIKELDWTYKYYEFSRDGVSVALNELLYRISGIKSFRFIDKDGCFIEPLKGLTEYQLDSLERCDDIMLALPENASIVDATYFGDGYAGISPDSIQWFIIDKYLVIHGYGEESIFEDFGGFSNGIAAVKRNGKWGYVDTKIKEIIPCKYDSCGGAYTDLEEIFEYDIQGNIAKVAYINRNDSLVWESKIPKPVEIQNNYSNKDKKEYGQWKYKYNLILDHIPFGLSGVLGALLFVVIVVCVVLLRKTRTPKMASEVASQTPFQTENVGVNENIEEPHIFPSVGQYTEMIKLATKSPEDFFDKLRNLRPMLDTNGEPIMSVGNFAVVFKMVDENGHPRALRCFHRTQEGRGRSYKLICEELVKETSSYISPIRYLEKELLIDSEEYPVLLMDWIEGLTLDRYIRKVLNSKRQLCDLAKNFSELAVWLLNQPFAHGDLKPDNILVREDGTLVLVDYDGMYVPAMKGQMARELGTPGFRNPLRTEADFDKNIDIFPIITILLSLELLIENKEYLSRYGADDRLLFSENDFRDFSNSSIFQIASQSHWKNIRVLSQLLIEDISGKEHTIKKVRTIIKKSGKQIDYRTNEKIDRIATIIFALYSVAFLAFPLFAFFVLEWRIVSISMVLFITNTLAFILFNIIDSFRPDKTTHVLENTSWGCLGMIASFVPTFFMFKSSYNEEWYITTITWVYSIFTVIIFFGITSLNEFCIERLLWKYSYNKREKIDWIELLQSLGTIVLTPPFIGLWVLIPMIMNLGWNSFFLWLKYVTIIDAALVIVCVLIWLFKRIFKIKT